MNEIKEFEPNVDTMASQSEARTEMLNEVFDTKFTNSLQSNESQSHESTGTLPSLSLGNSIKEKPILEQLEKQNELVRPPHLRIDNPNPIDLEKYRDIGRPINPMETMAKADAEKVFELLKDGKLSPEDLKALSEILQKAHGQGYLERLTEQLNKKLKDAGFGVSVDINSDFANVKDVNAILVTIKGLGQEDIRTAVKVDNSLRSPHWIKPYPVLYQ